MIETELDFAEWRCRGCEDRLDLHRTDSEFHPVFEYENRWLFKMAS